MPLNFADYRSSRSEFTEDEKEKLCQYLAVKTPYKEHGGRTAQSLYKLLMEQVTRWRAYMDHC
jgi:hypothetical protein